MDTPIAPDFVRTRGYLTLGSRLKRLGERLQGDVQRFATTHGIDVPAGLMPVIGVLREHPRLAVGEIADLVGIAQPNVSRALVRLIEMGLVEDSSSTGDRRQRHVSLTPHGVEVATRMEQELWPRVERAVAELCDLPDGPLLTTLARIEAALDATTLDRRIEEVVL